MIDFTAIKKTFTEMRQALNTVTGRNTQWIFGGEVLTAITGFLINVILLRKMSIDDYGLFSLFLSLMMLFSGFMHLGWTETYVRFGSLHRGSSQFDGTKFHAYRSAIGGMVATSLLVVFLAPIISVRGLHRPDFIIYVRWSAIAALFTSLFALAQTDLRVHQDIPGLIGMKLGSSVLRLLCGALAVAFGVVTLPVVTGIYLLSPVLFFVKNIYRWALAEFPLKSRPQVEGSLRSEMGKYNKWIFVSFLTTTIIGNIDSQILAHFHNNATLSAFNAASRLTLPIQMIVISMSTTLLPRLSAMRETSEIRLYLRRLALFLVPAVMGVLLVCWFAPPLLIWIAGPKYEGISTLIRLQVLVTLVVLISNPVGLIINSWGWSRLLALMNGAQLFVDLILDLLWIPRWGASGAVSATLVVNLIGMVTIYLGVAYGLRPRRSAT